MDVCALNAALGLLLESGSVLGCRSYQAAWVWLHKLRRAMVRPGRERLTRRVEVYETYLGGPEEGGHDRKLTRRKTLTVVAAQKDGAGIEGIRTRRIKDASAASLEPFVVPAIGGGGVVHTDGAPQAAAAGHPSGDGQCVP